MENPKNPWHVNMPVEIGRHQVQPKSGVSGHGPRPHTSGLGFRKLCPPSYNTPPGVSSSNAHMYQQSIHSSPLSILGLPDFPSMTTTFTRPHPRPQLEYRRFSRRHRPANRHVPLHKVFRFFDLPAELRNFVYSHLVGGFRYKTKSNEFADVTSDSFMLPKLRLLCRQFTSEYEAEILRTCEVEFSTDDDAPEDICKQLMASLAVSIVSSRLQHVVLYYYFSGDSLNELSDSRQKIRQESKILVQSLPALKSLRLEADVSCAERFVKLYQEGFRIEDYFTLDVLSHEDRTTYIHVERVLLLTNDLYSVNPRVVTDAKLAKELEDSDENSVSYRVIPAQKAEHSWCGLELRCTEDAGSFDVRPVSVLEDGNVEESDESSEEESDESSEAESDDSSEEESDESSEEE